jgi:hypothetical protein
MDGRPRRAGERITDLCRACKLTREHTVMAVDSEGRVLRVVCGFCGSQHNYRGGGDEEAPRAARPTEPPTAAAARPAPAAGPAVTEGERAITKGERTVIDGERTERRMPESDRDEDVERLFRRVLREELGLTPTAPAEKWRGGELVLRPGKPGLQEKKWPIESFFHKVVMIRNRLRTLEQQVNASELPEDAKLRLQSYITGCYGSLTSFNVLFADEADQFRGSGDAD